MRKNNIGLIRKLAIVALVAQMLVPFVPFSANAAMTQVLVRFNRMKQSTGGAGDLFTDGTVCANITGATGTESGVDVTFPTGMVVSTTKTDWSVGTTNTGWPTGASAWTGITQPSVNPSSQTVNFLSSDITSDGLYCFNWTNTTAALKTNTTAADNQTGTVATVVSGGSVQSSTYATSTIANDQVSVNATVPPLFSFALSTNTDNFTTNLSSSSIVRTTGMTVTVGSNAKNGWLVWAKDANTGLTSAASTHTIAAKTPGTNVPSLGTGAEGYITGVVVTAAGTTAPATASTVAPTTPYDGSSVGSNAGSGLDSSLRQMATANGTTSGSVINFQEKAAISAATPAATDYTDTITILGAGNF